MHCLASTRDEFLRSGCSQIGCAWNTYNWGMHSPEVPSRCPASSTPALRLWTRKVLQCVLMTLRQSTFGICVHLERKPENANSDHDGRQLPHGGFGSCPPSWMPLRMPLRVKRLYICDADRRLSGSYRTHTVLDSHSEPSACRLRGLGVASRRCPLRESCALTPTLTPTLALTLALSLTLTLTKNVP